jgi:solute carrier family 39 (zinc transporter), member 1/2/3
MAPTMFRHGCGGDVAEGVREIDLPVDIAALFALLLTSTFGNRSLMNMSADSLGALFPIVAARVKRLRIPQWVFFSVKHFGTGVIIATAFIHVQPRLY